MEKKLSQALLHQSHPSYFTLRSGCCFSFLLDSPQKHPFAYSSCVAEHNEQATSHPTHLSKSTLPHTQEPLVCSWGARALAFPVLHGSSFCGRAENSPNGCFFWYFLSPSTGRNSESMAYSQETHLRAAAKMLIFVQVIPG